MSEELKSLAVLVVEDREIWWQRIGPPLQKAGARVTWKKTRESAIEAIKTGEFAIAFLDLDLSGSNSPEDGLSILDHFSKNPILDTFLRPCNPAFIVVTKFDYAEPAVRAVRAGAQEFLVKSADGHLGELALAVARKYLDLRRERQARLNYSVVYSSPEMARVMELVARFSERDDTVLITGQSGTGKEVVARALHELWSSKRGTGAPFIPLNVGVLPETLVESELFGYERGAFTGATGRKIGLFEIAAGGTLFLDEIGEASPSVQVKLLRVLEDRKMRRIGGTNEIPVNVRLIAATNKDLPKAIEEGRFRMDLFYRLNVLSLEIPPLRQRPSDIPALVDHFIHYFNETGKVKVSGITPDALNSLMSYDWPGNVRELMNVVARAMAVTSGPLLQQSNLPDALQTSRPSDGEPSSFEQLRSLAASASPDWDASINSIRGIVYKSGRRTARLPKDPELTAAIINLIGKLNLAGNSYEAIAHRLGVSAVALRKWRTRWGGTL